MSHDPFADLSERRDARVVAQASADPRRALAGDGTPTTDTTQNDGAAMTQPQTQPAPSDTPGQRPALAPADAAAVDALLGGGEFKAPADGGTRAGQAAKLLSLLDAIPEPAPRRDLLALTMQRVEETRGVRVGPVVSTPGHVSPTYANAPQKPEGT